jgi:hypothetical protein
MTDLTPFASLALKLGLVGVIANEVRGFVLAAPVLYAMYLAGGTAMAVWVGFCSLAGIAMSVILPTYAVGRLKLLPARTSR